MSCDVALLGWSTRVAWLVVLGPVFFTVFDSCTTLCVRAFHARLPFVVHPRQGSWYNDKQEGNGVMTYRDGSHYNGQWRKAMRNGQGTCNYANRDVYTGKWMADKRSGKGTCVYSAGHRYEGGWKNDKRHGFGRMDYANGDEYRGGWERDGRHGDGVFLARDRYNYTGQVSSMLWTGFGCVDYAWGFLYSPLMLGACVWCGHPATVFSTVWFVLLLLLLLLLFVVQFADDMRHGEGKCVYLAGEPAAVVRCEWVGWCSARFGWTLLPSSLPD